MTPLPTAVLDRLRAANPQSVELDRGLGLVAQAQLVRILDASLDETTQTPSGRRHRVRRLPTRLLVVVAALLAGGGGAFAASDPLGWWSSSPDTAMYGASVGSHVRTPRAPSIGCLSLSGVLRCSAAGSGQRYTRIDVINPVANGFTRTALLAYTTRRLASGAMTASQAARFRADLAAVPGSFFTEFRLASRYGTYGAATETTNGRERVPPQGTPEFLVCEMTGSRLSCRNLNGDLDAAVGAGVYLATPARDWHTAPPEPESSGGLPPGISFTAAEYRVLADIARFATVTESSGSTNTNSGGLSRKGTRALR